MNQKPGYKSTEFYGHGFTSLVGAVAATGVLNPDLKETLDQLSVTGRDTVVIIQTLADYVVQIIGLITAFVSQSRYGKGRAIEKVAIVKRIA